jgi:hypothetical protein
MARKQNHPFGLGTPSVPAMDALSDCRHLVDRISRRGDEHLEPEFYSVGTAVDRRTKTY